MYWSPEPLAKTPHSQTYPCPHIFDAPVSWFISQRVIKFYPKELDVPTLIPPHELFQIITPKKDTYFYTEKDEKPLPHVLYDNFLVVRTGNMEHAYITELNSEYRYSCTFLVFQKTENGYILYPRSIFSPSSLSSIGKMFKKNTLEKVIPQWRNAFKKLPDFAWTEHHKHTGRLVRLGCVPQMKVEWNQGHKRWWATDEHPFWENTKSAFLAMAALHNVAFPNPPEHENSYHWTAYGPSRDNNFEHSIHKIEVPFSTWGSLSLQDTHKLPAPTEKQNEGLNTIRTHLPWIMEKHAPNIPFFFDRIFGEKHPHPKDHKVHLTSMMFPWINDTAAVKRTRNAHDAMVHMRSLPKEWQESVLSTLQK